MITHELFKKEIKKLRIEVKIHEKKIKNYKTKLEEEEKKKEIFKIRIEEVCKNYLNNFEKTNENKITTKEMIEKIMSETISPKDNKMDTNIFYQENGKEYIDETKFINVIKESLT